MSKKIPFRGFAVYNADGELMPQTLADSDGGAWAQFKAFGKDRKRLREEGYHIRPVIVLSKREEEPHAH